MAYINQNVLPSHRTQQLPIRKFTGQGIDGLVSALRQTSAQFIGVSLHLTEDGRVAALAFATTSEVFHVSLPANAAVAGTNKRAGRSKSTPSTSSIPAVTTTIHCQLHKTLVGFSMARIALHLFRDQGWHTNGVDLSSLLISPLERTLYPSEFVERKVTKSAKRGVIDALWYPDNDDEDIIDKVCQRAWISAVCANECLSAVQSAVRVDTQVGGLRSEHLTCLANMILCAELLEAQKPIRVENDFGAIMTESDGLVLQNTRFKTRVRASNQTSVVFETDNGEIVTGQAVTTNGKRTRIQVMEGQYRGGITSVSVQGREELTCAENAREEFVLRILQGKSKLRDRMFIDLLWFPTANSARAGTPVHPAPPRTKLFMGLNKSQREVAAAMVSPFEPLVIAHGPPGTGKTTTIAAAVDHWVSEGGPAWVVAQSNVGVKNIARSLVSKGVTDFKLIVSKEFYVEWHEDLYKEIQDNIIRSDDLSKVKDAYETERFLLGSRIILCTLSTLSNPLLDSCWVHKIVPVEKLIVDEASQINVFEFMHLFHKFKQLEKVCFFGDPKQLPPFGQDAVRQLQSIFDVKHLKLAAYFLNIQYRMPTPLGNFISHEVYNSKLKSEHKIHDYSCVAFINAAKGQEAACGKSWTNHEEVQIVVKLVQDYYRNKDFCVITPYDAQRSAIVKALISANLPSDRVFNVDSFQGHEAEYVIISATRTARPGFLSLQSRTNVMLTRCRAGMIIVSNAFFASSRAEHTLFGKLAAYWEDVKPHDTIWIDWRRVLERTVDLPGAAGQQALLRTSRSLHASTSPSRTQITVKPGTSSLSTVPHLPSDYVSPAVPESHTSIESLQQRMSRLRVVTSSSARYARVDDPDFPEIPNLEPPAKQPALQGQWGKGSKSIKHR